VIAVSQAGWVVTFLVVWLAIGFGIWLVLGRRGHDGVTWFLIGTLAGPVGILVAIDAAQHDESQEPVLQVAGRRRPGTVDVLVGADGSRAARAALESAIDLFGPSLGRVTLLRAVPFDGGVYADRHAEEAVEAEAARYPELEPGVEVRGGHPAAVLMSTARRDGYDVVVIGSRSAGPHPFGSTARELATSSPVPVLLVSEHGPTIAGADAEAVASSP
jgi:nucleotide-binding universal stress UspA family protein